MIRKLFAACVPAAVLFFWTQAALPAMSHEELLRKLDELSEIIRKQQQQIDDLKRELLQQKQSIDAVKEGREEKIDRAVKAEAAEQEKDWKEYIPKWLKQIKVSGDLRLRYEGLYNREQLQADRTIEDVPTRDRFRLRARLFFDGRITDELSSHFMISTNQDTNQEATTTNQSFTDDFNDKGIYLHRAYAVYTPAWLKGLELAGGKFKNTFLHTDIMWDPDVNQEGFHERYQYAGWTNFTPFVHLGQMMVNEVNKETDDAWLYIYQLGYDWKIGPARWILAGSYYDWTNLHNTEFLHNAEYKGGGGNTFVLEGDTLQYAFDYNLWEAVSFIHFDLGPIPVVLIFDYIVNIADDVPGDQDTAYFAGFLLGSNKKQGDIRLLYKYARIERDAVVGSLNDQDFYGANRKGHKVQFTYMLYDRLAFSTSLFYTDNISPWDPASPNFENEQDREHEDRLQVDLIFKF